MEKVYFRNSINPLQLEALNSTPYLHLQGPRGT